MGFFGDLFNGLARFAKGVVSIVESVANALSTDEKYIPTQKQQISYENDNSYMERKVDILKDSYLKREQELKREYEQREEMMRRERERIQKEIEQREEMMRIEREKIQKEREQQEEMLKAMRNSKEQQEEMMRIEREKIQKEREQQEEMMRRERERIQKEIEQREEMLRIEREKIQKEREQQEEMLRIERERLNSLKTSIDIVSNKLKELLSTQIAGSNLSNYLIYKLIHKDLLSILNDISASDKVTDENIVDKINLYQEITQMEFQEDLIQDPKVLKLLGDLFITYEAVALFEIREFQCAKIKEIKGKINDVRNDINTKTYELEVLKSKKQVENNLDEQEEKKLNDLESEINDLKLIKEKLEKSLQNNYLIIGALFVLVDEFKNNHITKNFQKAEEVVKKMGTSGIDKLSTQEREFLKNYSLANLQEVKSKYKDSYGDCLDISKLG